MTRRLVLAGGLATATGAAWADGRPPLAGQMKKFTLHPKPRPAPEAPFKTRAGEPTNLADFKGRVLLVNYWATWCSPCVAEMPSLDRLEASLGGNDFAVLPIASDRAGLKVVEPFYEKAGLKKLPIYLDQDMKFTRSSGVRGLPTTLLVDRTGHEVGRMEGDAAWDSKDAEALIRRYLVEKSDPSPIKARG
ncbi:MAG: TlpA family protein disulfide reductase [Alphaproteobacteria bacterium]|nr:TlpA family protein disulfide reductase [Alphaproteobacteria bacterium]